MVGCREAADRRGEPFGGSTGLGDGAPAWDFQPASVSWRKAYREGRLGDVSVGRFVPAQVVPETSPPGGVAATGEGRMEIVSANGRRVMVGRDVDVAFLLRIVQALETLR